MFYSQFILAKKGPLGTIWIAAHLERKLKKNQVADTDIGVSVDSILFPEVPIALRLSSHLLLGVVRIYSRKVNYLFHDCSEALLKVKQAFRSTAVDLPPEESTAPYHSITLPETFDLDDFELPDSALLHGNFDDRHVSTREQITLQDTLDGTGYSTSQFGLDERFGDGDACQMGLDLEEELLLNNNLTLQDASVLDGASHQGEGATDAIKMDFEEDCDGNGGRNDEASEDLSELLGGSRGKHVLPNVETAHKNDDTSNRLIFNIQTPDLNEVFLPEDHVEGASAVHDIEMDFGAADPPSPEFNQSVNLPFTPAPPEETIGANSCELPASNHQSLSPDAAPEIEKLDEPISQQVEATNVVVNAVSASPKSTNLAQVVSSPTSVLGEPKPDSVAPTNDNGQDHVESRDRQSSSSIPALAEPVSDSLTPQICSETIADPVIGSDVREADALCTGAILDEANGQQASMDNPLVSGVVSTIKVPQEDNTRPSNLDEGHVADVDSCLTSNFFSLSSDFHLRPCTSEPSQHNFVSSCNMVQDRPHEDQPCNLETHMENRGMHFSGFSVDPQGFHSVIPTGTNLGVDQNSYDMLLRLKSGVNDPVELSSDRIPKDVQSVHWNYFSSSEFSEPERMRFVASGNVNLSNDLGQLTTEKVIIESDGSVDRISNLSGQKRPLVDSTPYLQNDISPKMSGVPRKKRNSDYVPNDDDLLASILVGRRTPAVGIGPTPPLPKPPSSKRPRLTAKAGLPKRRKVLLDETIVLHADAIRQQLINTEDIRRLRKKAPCTRPEIWRIQKSSLEDDVLCESIFTGVSEDLNKLLARTYDLTQNDQSQMGGHHISSTSLKDVELSRSSASVRDNDGREMAGQNSVLPNSVDGEMQVPSTVSELIGAESCKNRVSSADAQDQIDAPHDVHNVDSLGATVSRGELDTLEHSGIELVAQTVLDSGIEGKRDDMCTDIDQNSLNKVVQTSCDLLEVNNKCVIDFNSAGCAAGEGVVSDIVLAAVSNDTTLGGKDFSNAKGASITVEDMGGDIVNVDNLDCNGEGPTNVGNPTNVGKDDCSGVPASILDRLIADVRQDFPADRSTVTECVDASMPDSAECVDASVPDSGPVTSEYQTMKDSAAGNAMAGYEVDEGRPVSEVPDGERSQVDPHPVLPCMESERVPSAVGENTCLNIEGGLDVESTPVDFAAARESSDFCSAIDDIDTDFLNVDDDVDEYDEEANDDMPNTEEAQSLENSGWSSRTRGVARYLKNMFDQESGRGRKSVAIDHLLAGKTRKEASRMFFETLVLKTRDYIHVEQENPFDCVNIKPRIKLLKSEF